MSTMRRQVLLGTTSTAGAVIINGERTILGRLYAVKWIDGDLVDGVDAVLSAIGGVVDTPLLTLSNADNDAIYYPRNIMHSESGAALTGTSGGDRDLMLIDGQLRLTIASGGDTKTGGAIIYWLDN